MHPIFRNTTSLGAYLALWTVLAALMAALMRIPSDLAWSQALSIAVPLCMFYAFVCLTPWYLCRGIPAGLGASTRLLINQLACGDSCVRAVDRRRTAAGSRDGPRPAN